MTEKQVQASVNQHLRTLRALEIELEVTGQLSLHSEAFLPDIEQKIEELIRKMESQRDFLYMLESGDIDSYLEVMG